MQNSNKNLIYNIPVEDYWFIDEIIETFELRLQGVFNDDVHTRRFLLKFITKLKLLPSFSPETSMSLSFETYQFELGRESFSFYSYTDDWHTLLRQQYFIGDYGHHCIEWTSQLDGEDKKTVLSDKLDWFKSSFLDGENDEVIVIEDISNDGFSSN